jgi:N-acetylneuraminate lyase
MEFERLSGLVAAPPTAMHEDGSVNLDVIERQMRSLAEAGVRGAFVCGTTGESMSLSTRERMSVLARWVAVAPEEFTVIAHAGHTSLAEARALAEHARDEGAGAVAAMPPCFFRPKTAEDAVDFLAHLAEACPALPVYYYHIPSMTGVDLPMLDLMRVAADRIPNFGGMKFTHENLMDYGRCVEFADGRFNVLFGRDEILLSALALGATGAVGSTYNLAAPLYLKVMDAFERGDLAEARRHQNHAAEFVAVLGRYGGLAAAKAAMRFVGVDCGPPRLPLCAPGPDDLGAMRGELEEIGFFDWCNGS